MQNLEFIDQDGTVQNLFVKKLVSTSVFTPMNEEHLFRGKAEFFKTITRFSKDNEPDFILKTELAPGEFNFLTFRDEFELKGYAELAREDHLKEAGNPLIAQWNVIQKCLSETRPEDDFRVKRIYREILTSK